MIVGWSSLGVLLGLMTWISYYTWWDHNPHNALVFAIAAGSGVVVFLAYLRFVKFMERP